MTKVYLTNADNEVTNSESDDKYYIEVQASKIEYDYTSNIQKILERAKSLGNQDSASDTYFIDTQKRAKIITVYCSFDKYANRTSGWSASAVDDASVVRKRLEFMYDRGRVNKVYIGYGDGYDDRNGDGEDEVHTCVIAKMKISEGGHDHIVKSTDTEDYPGSDSAAKVIQYDAIITLRLGKLRGD